MASTKEYLFFILEQLSQTNGVSYRAMMGEYIIYLNGKVIGGIYDDRFLVKQTPSSIKMLDGASLELPYPGAKEMLLVQDLENKEFLSDLLYAICDELLAGKRK